METQPDKSKRKIAMFQGRSQSFGRGVCFGSPSLEQTTTHRFGEQHCLRTNTKICLKRLV